MNFSLFANIHKDSNGDFLKQVTTYLKSIGANVIHDEIVTKGGFFDVNKLKNTDMIITLGGDGTLLDMAQKTKNTGIPLVGINLGSVGFLTQIEKRNYEEMLLSIFHKEFDISNRMTIKADVIRNGITINSVEALNDIVITREATGDTVEISSYINGSYIDSYNGDGIIVSTPTGSTGYQMSAGGPVSDPEADIILVTPICPHMMHRQTYVIKGDGLVELEVREKDFVSCYLSYDGISYNIKGNDLIRISKSDLVIKLVKIQKNPFYENLRNKIYYRGN